MLYRKSQLCVVSLQNLQSRVSIKCQKCSYLEALRRYFTLFTNHTNGEKMDNPNLEYYEELIHAEDAIQFDGLDYAIVGVSHTGYYIYDYDRMIECFIADDEINEGEAMTEEEAIEWIDYNVIGTNGGQGFIILYSNEQI